MTLEIARRFIDGGWKTSPLDESGGGGSQPVQQTIRSFTAAQIRSLFTDSPITLIATPGAGKIIVPLRCQADYAAGSRVFFSASGTGTNAAFALGSAALSFFVYGTSGAQPALALADSLAQNVNTYLNFAVSLIDSVTFLQNRVERAAGVNQPLTLSANHGNLTNGALTSSTIQAAGSGYAAGDTLADDGMWGAGDLLVTVNTVDGSGHVLTYTVTDAGTSGWASGQAIGFANVAPQSGAGTGFQLTAGITPGNGTLRLTIDYEVLTLT